jgi:nucleolar protein 56
MVTVYLTLTSFGIFVLDSKSKVVVEQLTYPDAELASSDIMAVNDGSSPDSLKTVLKSLEELKIHEIVVAGVALARVLSQATKIPVRVDEKSDVVTGFRNGEDAYLVESGKVGSVEEVSSFRRNVALTVAKATVVEASEEKDILVKHAVDTIGEIDKSVNVLTMRLREIYSLHHPSLSRLVEDNKQFVQTVRDCGGRLQINKGALAASGLSDSLIKSIMESLDEDTGAEFQDADIVILRKLAERIVNLYEMRHELEEYLSGLMSTLAPNVTALVGPLVGARLISLAGSLMELARKPSSAVQIFGAEKALFRSLKTGASPPKHGVIFQVADIHTAPYWQRGKIARALAGKLSIAARIDAYSEKDVGEDLRARFNKRVEEIRRLYPEAPPPKPPRKPDKRSQKKRERRDHRPGKRRKWGN